MDEKSAGLILRTRPLTESSLIVHWLTPELGRIATVAKGARRPKSPFRGKLDLFHLADLSFVRSRRSELHILREVSVRETHRALREDMHLLQQAAYCAQLIEQTTETDTPLPGLFRLLLDLLTFLTIPAPKPAQSGAGPPAPAAEMIPVFAFEMKLLAAIGLQPDIARVELPPGTRAILRQLAVADWGLLAQLRLSSGQVVELRQFLHGFLIYHLGRLPAGRAAAVR